MIYIEELYNETLYEGPLFLGAWSKAFSFTFVAGTTVSVTATLDADIPMNCSVRIYAGETLATMTELLDGIKSPILFLSTTSGATNIYVRLDFVSTIRGDTPIIRELLLLVEQETSLYTVATQVLSSGLTPYSATWNVDTELQKYLVPYGFVAPATHRAALAQVAEACGGVVYQDRTGIIQLEAGNFAIRESGGASVDTITDNRILDVSSPVSQVKNTIQITTFPYAAQPSATVWTLTGDKVINAGQSRTFSINYYKDDAVIDGAVTLSSSPVGATVTSEAYFSWGAEITVLGSANGQVLTMSIDAIPLAVDGSTVVQRTDGDSIRTNGARTLAIEGNKLIQNTESAGKIADDLLEVMADAFRDIDLQWRGDPTLELGDIVTVKGQRGIILTQEFNFNGALSASAQIRKV